MKTTQAMRRRLSSFTVSSCLKTFVDCQVSPPVINATLGVTDDARLESEVLNSQHAMQRRQLAAFRDYITQCNGVINVRKK